ncbi:hypothetical protein E2C01_096527 [Portunus trituberculatus]|uniref:Uncharacterized protein n=1 Tax=Portunus trituberculatus TaxID=210409 RepID=A0A5B7K375_PORTR|nr:hypothetical protein [Portunus trituberculatus]
MFSSSDAEAVVAPVAYRKSQQERNWLWIRPWFEIRNVSWNASVVLSKLHVEGTKECLSYTNLNTAQLKSNEILMSLIHTANNTLH